jgi:hypothetical protein
MAARGGLFFVGCFLLHSTKIQPPNIPMRPVTKSCAWAGTVALLTLCGLLPAAEPNHLSETERAEGWKLLFDGQSPAGWHTFKKTTFPAKGWEAKEGWLHCLGQNGGDLISAAEFEDFELQWEWRLAANGNSGLKYFISETRSSPIGHEYQLIDDDRNEDAKLANGKRLTGGLYDVLKPVGAKAKPMGEVNQSRILVKGNHVEHWLNGEKVLEYECGSEAMKAAVAASKFKNTPGFGQKIKGHFLLQDHHSEVWFRNLKIRELK